MFPKVNRKKEQNLETVNVQFLKEKLELILDKEKCEGCGVCSRACPKEAISKQKLNEPIRFSSKQIIKKVRHFLIPNVRDPSSCVYCGTCAYLCPFNALSLSINGEPIPLEELQLVKQNALPKLDYEIRTLDSGKTAKVYTEGNVTNYVREVVRIVLNPVQVVRSRGLASREKYPGIQKLS